MKPIKNVFPASEGSEKWYSVNGGESTKMLIGRKWDEAGSLGTRLQLCLLFWIALTLFQRHIVLLEIVVLANSKKNRNIKAHDVNLISVARSTDFCFKTTACKYVLCFRLIVGSSPFGKEVSHESPYPSEITAFEPPSPSDFQWSSVGVGGQGGMDIFWNHSMKVDDGSGWKGMRVDKSGWKWVKVDRWIKVNENGWRWMTLSEDGWRWMIVNESETSI